MADEGPEVHWVEERQNATVALLGEDRQTGSVSCGLTRLSVPMIVGPHVCVPQRAASRPR